MLFTRLITLMVVGTGGAVAVTLNVAASLPRPGAVPVAMML